MANLKKHFVFKVGSSSSSNSATGTSSSGGGGSHGVSPSSELLPPGFSKSAFMNEVSSLLDQCGLYVSAMNGFCTSGCSLAKCLVRVFHAVPLYRETATTLLSNWDEIAQTTAAASASVKTETLMQLQDVLTRLETSGENKEDELAESVHAVSSCLMAYIELQAQFSYSVFKALGKLSRQQHGNGFLRTSRAEEAVRKQFSQIINRLTGPSTAKTPPSPAISQATTPVQPTQSSAAAAVWPAEIHLAPSSGELLMSAQHESASSCLNEIPDSGLDDVINLLSIGATSPSSSSAPSASSASSSSVTASAPPKIPPRPDAFSQDAFRIKQQRQQQQLEASLKSSGADVADESKKLETPSWSPWGPDWSTEDLSNWPSHSSDASDYEPGWMRWQSTSAKEKTQTWPRPLRDPTAPWEWHDDETEDMLDTWKAGNHRDGERVAKTCTWPLKVASAADGSWQEQADPWRKDDSLPVSTAGATTPGTPQATPWKSGDEEPGFHLFNQR